MSSSSKTPFGSLVSKAKGGMSKAKEGMTKAKDGVSKAAKGVGDGIKGVADKGVKAVDDLTGKGIQGVGTVADKGFQGVATVADKTVGGVGGVSKRVVETIIPEPEPEVPPMSASTLQAVLEDTPDEVEQTFLEEVKLIVEIVAARDLIIGDLYSSDPYVKVCLGTKEIHKTKHISKTYVILVHLLSY